MARKYSSLRDIRTNLKTYPIVSLNSLQRELNTPKQTLLIKLLAANPETPILANNRDLFVFQTDAQELFEPPKN